MRELRFSFSIVFLPSMDRMPPSFPQAHLYLCLLRLRCLLRCFLVYLNAKVASCRLFACWNAWWLSALQHTHIHTRTPTRTCTRAHARTLARAHARSFTCIHTTHTHTHTHTHTNTQTHKHTNTHTHTLSLAHTHKRVDTYKRMAKYIIEHTQTQIFFFNAPRSRSRYMHLVFQASTSL